MGHLEGIRIYANGTRESQTFADYDRLCRWLAEQPEAGIAAYNLDTDEALDQRQLQGDVTHYHA